MATSKIENRIAVGDWGCRPYRDALNGQRELVKQRQDEAIGDKLILTEHPPTITFGRRAGEQDLRLPFPHIEQQGVAVVEIDRGGQATAHEPGQLVAYPIIYLYKKNLRWYIDHFLGSMADLLREYGLEPELKDGNPGIWVNGRKIASFGIAVKRWVASHGMALNVNNDLKTFSMIVPCGAPTEEMTSMGRELGRSIDMAELKERFVHHFCRSFAYRLTKY